MDEPWMRPAVADHSTALLHRGSPLAAIPLSKRVFRLQCLSVTAKQFTFQTCPERVWYTPLWPVRLMISPGNKKNGMQNINFPTEMNISSWQLLSQISPDVHAKADMVPSVNEGGTLCGALCGPWPKPLPNPLPRTRRDTDLRDLCRLRASCWYSTCRFLDIETPKAGIGIEPLVGIVLYNWGLLHDHLASLPT